MTTSIGKGIYVYTRSYDRDRELLDHHTAGADRRRTLDAAIAKLPAGVRAQIARQLGRVLDGDVTEILGASASDPATDSAAWAWVRGCEVIS